MAPNNHHRIKLWLHTCAFLLMVPVLGIALYMMMNPVFLGGAPRTPMASRVGMSMAGKGLLFLSYQVLTENIRLFKRLASTKANLILNCIESIAWPAAAGVSVYGIMQFCIGITCTLSYIMIPLAAVLALVSFLSAWISLKEHRVYKATGQKPGDMKLETINSEDSNKAFNSGRSGVTIHQLPDKTPEPIHHSQSYNTTADQSNNGFGTPHQQQRHHYNQRQQEHYQHNQQQHYQQQLQQQQQYGSRR